MDPQYFPDKPEFYFRLEFEKRLNRSPWYSLRAFARDLGISPASLSDFLNGKAGISVERALILSKKVNLGLEHAEHFVDLISAKYSRSIKVKDLAAARSRARILAKSAQLANDQFEVVSDWYHFAILELVDLDLKFHNILRLAKSLGIKKTLVTEAVQRLEKLGLLACEGKVWKTSSTQTTVGDQVPSLAIQDFHRQILKKARIALAQQAISEREVQSSILSINKADLGAFKKDLIDAFDILVNKYHGRKNKNTVYCLSTQLFRLINDDSLMKEPQ